MRKSIYKLTNILIQPTPDWLERGRQAIRFGVKLLVQSQRASIKILLATQKQMETQKSQN